MLRSVLVSRIAKPVTKSLGRRTAVYVAAICALLIGVEIWREWTAQDYALQQAKLETHNLATSLRQHAEDTYEIAEQAVSSVALEMEVPRLPSETTAHVRNVALQALAATRRLHSLAVYDANGDLLLSTEEFSGESNQAGFTYFQNHRNSVSRAVFFGPPIVSSDGDTVMTVSRRFNDPSGRFGGVVLAELDTLYFAAFYKSFDVGRHGSISLVSSGGILLSRQPYASRLMGSDLSTGPLFRQELATRRSGNFEAVSSVDGVLRIGGYDQSPTYPVVAVVAEARDEALATWWQGAVQRALLTLAMTLVVAMLGLRLAVQIRRRQRSDEALAEREAEFRLLTESASDLVERFDEHGKRIYISPAIERLTGHTPAEMLGHDAFGVVNAEDRPAVVAATERLRAGGSSQETVSFRALHKDGRELWLETSLRVIEGAAGRNVVGVTRDVTDRKQLELELAAMAMRDGLTGIANRRAFDEALAREVARARRLGTPLSLLMIDTDWFKRFNDDYGHLAGDACLKSIAAVVSMAARRPTDLAARYGGEEMVLLLPDTDLGAARTLGNELCRQVQGLGIPHERNLPWKMATVSIGVACIDVRNDTTVPDAAWLVSTADLALYDAKAQGRNQCVAAPSRNRPRLVS